MPIGRRVLDAANVRYPAGAVWGCLAGGPADDAGLVAGYNESGTTDLLPGGDIILAVDKMELENFDQLIAYVIKHKQPGDVIQFTVLREEEEFVVPLVIGIAEEKSSDDW